MSQHTAFLFPGQGSQAIGMAQSFYESDPVAKAIIDQANEMIPGLKDIMFTGPDESLRRTLYAQPALLTASIAALTVFQKKSVCTPAYVAGHSLGEYSALVCAGVLTFESALTIVKRRAELMNNAPSGSMAAIIGLSLTDFEPILNTAKGTGIVVMANHNSPEQLVISGEAPAVEVACDLVREKVGPRRVISLPVSGAFHSPLMQAANDELAKLIAIITFGMPKMPVVSNLDGLASSDPELLKQKLSAQMVSSVQWVASMNTMTAAGLTQAIELGSGKVLSGLFKKTAPEVKTFNVSDMDTLNATVTELKQEAVA